MPQSASAFPALDARADMRRPESASVKAGSSGDFAAQLDESAQSDGSTRQETSAWQERQPSATRVAATGVTGATGVMGGAGATTPAAGTQKPIAKPVPALNRTAAALPGERPAPALTKPPARPAARRPENPADKAALEGAQSGNAPPLPAQAGPKPTAGVPTPVTKTAGQGSPATSTSATGEGETASEKAGDEAEAVAGTTEASQAAVAIALLAQAAGPGADGAPAPTGETTAPEGGPEGVTLGDGEGPGATAARQALAAGFVLPGGKGNFSGAQEGTTGAPPGPDGQMPVSDEGVVFAGKPAIEVAPATGKSGATSDALAALSSALADDAATSAGDAHAALLSDAGGTPQSPTLHPGHAAGSSGSVGPTDGRTPSPSPATPAVPIAALPIEIGMRALDGAQSFQIKLHPHDLGQVDVKLQIDDDGVVKAHVTVDRVETLNMLQRDSRTLERAFEQAGLKTSDGSLQFSLGSDTSQQQRSGRQHEPAPQQGSPQPLTDLSASPDLAAALRAIRLPLSGLDIRI